MRCWTAPGSQDDNALLDEAMALVDESRRQHEIGGGMTALYIGRRVIRLGMG